MKNKLFSTIVYGGVEDDPYHGRPVTGQNYDVHACHFYGHVPEFSRWTRYLLAGQQPHLHRAADVHQ